MKQNNKSQEEKEIRTYMEIVCCMFIDNIISYHERDELLMRLQIKLDGLK